MKNFFASFVGPVLVAFCAVTASGCVPLVIGAAAGIGGYVWYKGELTQEFQVPAEQLHRAATRAMRDLRLAVYEDKGDRLTAKIHAKFADGTDVNIHIAAKTEYKSEIRIRVGILGDKDKSESILEAIKRRL